MYMGDSDFDQMAHYVNRAIGAIRTQRDHHKKASIPPVWFARHLCLDYHPAFFGRLMANLIKKGVLTRKGRRLMIGVLPDPQKINPHTVAGGVEQDYARKTEAEKAAIDLSTRLAALSNRASNRRAERRAAMMMKRMR